MHFIKKRIEITVTTLKRACPYCKARPAKRVTCGSPECQYVHHILAERKNRKTDRKCPTITVSTTHLLKK